MTFKATILPPVAGGPPRAIVVGVVCGLAAAVIWAAQVSVSAIAVRGSLPAPDLMAIRYLTGGLVMLPVLVRHRALGPLAGIGWGRGIVLAIAGGVPFNLALSGGLVFAPASHNSIITNGLIPVFALLMGAFLLKTLPRGREVGGMTLVAAGVVALGWQSVMTDRTMPDAWIGDLMYVTAALLWAGYTVACRRWRVDPLRGTAAVTVLSLAYLPLWLFLFDSRIPAAPLGDIAFQAVYQGIVAGLVSLIVYTRAVENLGSNSASLFSAIVPALAILIAMPALGEIPGPLEWAGMALATGGMVLALSRRR